MGIPVTNRVKIKYLVLIQRLLQNKFFPFWKTLEYQNTSTGDRSSLHPCGTAAIHYPIYAPFLQHLEYHGILHNG